MEALPDNVPSMVGVMLSRLERDIGKKLVHGILGLLRTCVNQVSVLAPPSCLHIPPRAVIGVNKWLAGGRTARVAGA